MINYLVGGFFPTPLKNDGVEWKSVGMIFSFPTEWKVIKFHGSSHHQMEFHGIFSEILQGEFMGTARFFHEKSMEKGGVQRSSRSKVWNSALQTTKNEEDFRKQGMNEGWRLDVEGGFLFTFHHWGMWWAEIHHQNLGVWPSLAV